MTSEMDRREFLVATAIVGGGLALAPCLPAEAAAHKTVAPVNREPWLAPAEGGVEINPWIVIGADDSVTIRVNQSDLGQGVLTSNPMMFCEELECDWSKVRAVYADPNRHINQHKLYDHLNTDASSSVRLGRVLYQQMGASARERLKAAAAAEWGVPAAEIATRNGILTHKPTGRTLRYGAVAAKAAAIKLDHEPAIKTPDQYTLIGRRLPRFDVPLKARAEAVYAIDVRLPGMVYAASKQSPSYGGSLKSFDFDAIKQRPGVIAAVPLEGIGHASGVAVVADSWWRAKTALEAMPVVWDAGPNAGQGSAELFAAFAATLDRDGPMPVDEGDVEAAFRGAHKLVEAEYRLPHQAHAQMEPSNCTAQVTAERAEIWMGTQTPDQALLTAAKLTGLPTEKVFVHNTFEGGGFGRGGNHGDLEQAVLVAKALDGRPVKLLLTREEDLGHTNGFHPMGVARFSAALDEAGRPVALKVRIAGNDSIEGAPLKEIGPHQAKIAAQLLRGLNLISYGIANRRIEINTMKTFVPAAPWRSTGSYATAFYLESFIDELAHAAGQDPLHYRRALIAAASPDCFEDNAKDDWLRVLDEAAKRSGWGRKLPKGTGMGVAIDDRKSVPARGIALAAVVATVTVSQAGKVTVERLDIVHDGGHCIVNPPVAERQVRGMMAWGMGPTFDQEISFKNGAVEQSNFNDYAPTAMAEFPKHISVAFVKSNRWISGIGEEVVPLVAPAILNAVHAATGKRVRALPLRRHDLSWA